MLPASANAAATTPGVLLLDRPTSVSVCRHNTAGAWSVIDRSAWTVRSGRALTVGTVGGQVALGGPPSHGRVERGREPLPGHRLTIGHERVIDRPGGANGAPPLRPGIHCPGV
jgi:hypothetical protein